LSSMMAAVVTIWLCLTWVNNKIRRKRLMVGTIIVNIEAIGIYLYKKKDKRSACPLVIP
jgi:hypothetical protein